MKKLTFLLLTLLYAISLYSAPVSENMAKQIAENFFTSKEKFQCNEVISLAYKSISQQTNTAYKIMNSDLTYYYVFNKGTTGFIIISADDNTYPVLAYSNEGTFKPDNIPQNVAKWLEGYKQQIRYVIENNIQATAEIKNEWSEWLSGKDFSDKLLASVSPLIQTKWNQSPYVNALCPYDYDYGERTVTGCVATAMAQIMNYWEYPKKGLGFHSYNHQKYGTLSANFGNTNYNWENMPDVVSSTNNSVATLIYHCGISVDMNYNVASEGGSGAQTLDVVDALKTYFDYPSSVEGKYRNDYTDLQWISLLKMELDAGRPIQYAGTGPNGGHSFICDGYDNNDFFHFNWGWGGDADAYYNLNALNPGSGEFNDNQRALVGIAPPANAITYKLTLEEDVETDPSTIYYGQPFTITAYILNDGNNTFVGEYCAAVFDKNNNFCDYVQIKQETGLKPNYHYEKGLKFTSEGILSMLPGNYKIYIYYRPTDGNWIVLKAGDWDIFTDIYTEIKVINPNNIKLNSAITVLSGTTLTQGESASVNINILNDGETTFIGEYYVGLYNLDGTGAQVINTYSEDELLPNYHYPDGLTFETDLITIDPGTYLLAVQHKFNSKGYWELTGSTDEFINPIKVIVQKAPYSADIYESNNDIASAFNLMINYSNNIAKVKSTGSNFHLGNDYDFYKINLESGYRYSIDARLQDAFSNNDGNSYTVDALFAYSTDGINWSDTYDDILSNNIDLNGQQTVYFAALPYFLGQTGTYLLDLNISRSPIGSVDENPISDLIYVFPNPATDYLIVDFSKYQNLIIEAKIQNILGEIIYIDKHPSYLSFKIPTRNFINGTYFLVLTDNFGNLLTNKVTIIK